MMDGAVVQRKPIIRGPNWKRSGSGKQTDRDLAHVAVGSAVQVMQRGHRASSETGRQGEQIGKHRARIKISRETLKMSFFSFILAKSLCSSRA